MKPLIDLVEHYGANNISHAVGFVQGTPLFLPDDLRVHVEARGDTIHIYGINHGITEYKLGRLPPDMTITGQRTTLDGLEIMVASPTSQRIVLHSDLYQAPTAPSRVDYGSGVGRPAFESSESSNRGYQENSESRGGSGESRLAQKPASESSESRPRRGPGSSSESRGGSGESRLAQKPASESSESRPRRGSGSSGESHGGSGESRW